MENLSIENYNKIIEGGIYEANPTDFECYGNPYHCRNWIFKVIIDKTEKLIYMCDTYLDSVIKLTDDNFDKFYFIVKEDEIEPISQDDMALYDDKDIYIIAMDSGGYCGDGHRWIRKNAKVNKQKLLNKYNEMIQVAEDNILYAKDNIRKIENNTHYLLCEKGE